MALIINPTNEFSRILSMARYGESGDTYAFDQTGLIISQSRFDDQLRHLDLLAHHELQFRPECPPARSRRRPDQRV